MDRSRGQASIETALRLLAGAAGGLDGDLGRGRRPCRRSRPAGRSAGAAGRRRRAARPHAGRFAGAEGERDGDRACLRAARDPRLLAVANRRRTGGRAVRRRRSGQASVEMIGCAVLLVLATVAVLEALTIVRARITAERLADQAAVLVGEGRPLPASLRRADRAARRPRGGDGAAAGSPAGAAGRRGGDRNGAAVNDRGQVSVMACALVVLLVVAGFVIGVLGGIDSAGANAQRAADMAALAAGHRLSSDPAAAAADLRSAAADAARENGGRLVSLVQLTEDGLPSGVEVSVAVDGEHPVRARARVGVEFTAAEPTGSFRPVDLHGLAGRAAIVAAAAAQIGWPYVWGGESRAEGGFDCSGLVGYAYRAAGISLPGRPTAASLWSMARPVPIGGLAPGDLVFKGTASGAPFHVGIYAGGGAVIVAPHTGARVRFEPLSAGGWDGFGSLAAAGPATVAAVPDAALDAARAFDVPAHVVASEVRLGLAADARTAARTLAAAMAAHQESLEAAVAAQLGGASAAALVLRDGSGPALGDGFAAEVRLLPRTASDAFGGAQFRSPLPAGPPAQVRAGASLGSRLGDAGGAVAEGAERVLTQVGERGSHVAPQAFAAVRNAGRLGLTAASAVLPG